MDDDRMRSRVDGYLRDKLAARLEAERLTFCDDAGRAVFDRIFREIYRAGYDAGFLDSYVERTTRTSE